MALTATIRRLKLQLSDSDRGVYEALDLRLAQHPSETDAYLVTRILAYALCYEEDLRFSHGLSHADEPALWAKSPDGQITHWIEVGTPSAERLHRASKACPRVSVFTQHPVALIWRETSRATIHRAEEIALYAPDPALITGLAARLDRNMSWELVHSGGGLYVTCAPDVTLEGSLVRHSVREPG